MRMILFMERLLRNVPDAYSPVYAGREQVLACWGELCCKDGSLLHPRN